MNKLPTGWKETTLSELFNFQKKSGIKAGEGLDQGKYKLFTSSSMQRKFINEYKFDGEHLIIGTGGQASIHYCNEKFATSTDCFVVKVAPNILAKYVYYFIMSDISILEKGFKGAGLKHISKDYLGKIKVTFPEDKSVQKKIVSVLEKAEKLKETRKQANELSAQLASKIFLEMFGDPVKNEMKWEKVTLGSLCEIKTGGTPSRAEPSFWGGDIPWIKTTELRDSVISNTQERITKLGEQKSNATLFPKNTILVAMYGQGKTMGRTAKLEIDATTNQACAAMLPSKKYETDFIWQYLILSYIRLRKLAQGGNQPNLNLKLMRDFEVYNPTLEMQKEFAKVKRSIDCLIKKQVDSKIEISILFNSLMQKAFKGELVV